MADTHDNRPGEEEDEEEEIDDSVRPEPLQLPCPRLIYVLGVQDDERCRPLRHPCQSYHA
jgi:hypothetical protein